MLSRRTTSVPATPSEALSFRGGSRSDRKSKPTTSAMRRRSCSGGPPAGERTEELGGDERRWQRCRPDSCAQGIPLSDLPDVLGAARPLTTQVPCGHVLRWLAGLSRVVDALLGQGGPVCREQCLQVR